MLPKSAQPGAKRAVGEIWNAEDKDHALQAVKAFEQAYGAKFPKAVARITGARWAAVIRRLESVSALLGSALSAGS